MASRFTLIIKWFIFSVVCILVGYVCPDWIENRSRIAKTYELRRQLSAVLAFNGEQELNKLLARTEFHRFFHYSPCNAVGLRIPAKAGNNNNKFIGWGWLEGDTFIFLRDDLTYHQAKSGNVNWIHQTFNEKNN